DSGVSPVSGFEELQLASSGVGDECLVAPPVDLLEHRQLSARVWSFAADDDPHPVWPLGEHPGREESGQLGDLSALPDVTSRIQSWPPRGFGSDCDGSAQRGGGGEPDRVLHPSTTNAVLLGNPVQQVVGGAGAIGANQQITPMRGGDLGDRLAQDVDVI